MKKTMTIFGMTLAIILATGSALAANVAKIGSTNYTSLQAALDAVQDGETVQMIADSVETAGSTVASGKTVTLDLNGKAISYTSAFGAAFNLIAVNGNLTVTDTSAEKNGSIALTSTANLSWDYAVNMFLVGNGGSLTIEEGSYSVSTPSYGYAEYVIAASNNSGSSTVVINGGTLTGNNIDAVVRLHDQYNRANTTLNVTVNGGVLTLNGSQCDSVIWFDVQKSGNGTDNTSVASLVVNGGTLTSTSNSPALDIGHDVDASGLSVTVNGGAFKSNGAVIKTRNLSEAAIAKIKLLGGIYSGDDYYNAKTDATLDLSGLTDGKVMVANVDAATKAAYPYTVGVAVAKIGNAYYATLAAAIADVPTDGTATTITMIADEAIDIAGNAMQIAVGKNVVLDLNGHEVVGFCSTGEYSAMILNNGTLTIVDSTDVDADGTGEGKLMYSASPSWNWSGVDGDYSGSYASNLIANNGTVCVESGFLEVTNPAGKISSASYVIDTAPGGSVVITGGKLISSCSDVIRMRVSNSAESVLNISGGSVVALLPSKRAIWLQAYSSNAKSTVNVSGGLISGSMYSIQDDSSGSYAKDTITGGTFSGFIYTTAELDISGGAFNGGYGGSTVYSVMAYGSKASISGGVFYGFAAFYSTASSLDWSVTGGAFSYGGPYQYAGYTSEEFVRGGIYDYEPRYLAPGYVVANNTDPDTKVAYPYAVILPVASITVDDETVYYATFEDAIDDAELDDSVVITVIGYDAATMVAPDGWKFVTENDVTTLVRAHYVAQIEGGAKFESLQEAINAAQDGQTVELLSDLMVENANVATTKALYTVRKSINIDGNNKTITVSDTGSKNVINIVFNFYETEGKQPVACAMKDLTIESTGFQIGILAGGFGTYANTLALSNVTARGQGEVIYASDTSSITATDCEFAQSGEHAANKEAEYYTAVAVGYDGVVELNGCTVSSDGHNAIASFGSGGTVTLDDTSVEATGENSKALWAYAAATYSTGDANIVVNEGCTVIGSVSATTTATNSRKATITINDGYFSQHIEDDTGYIVEGKTCTTKKMLNGFYKIVPKATVTYTLAGTEPEELEAVLPSPASFTYASGDLVEIELAVPSYNKEGNTTFGGWKIKDSDPEQVIAKVSSGATVDMTLIATWKTAKKIEVVTVESEEPEQEQKATITVTDEWVEANVEPAEATATIEEIQTELNKTQANGLKGWENYVLGHDPSAAVKVDSKQGASEETVPVANTFKGQTVDTGFKVQYSLDKVSETGTTITEGTKQDTSDLSLDLTKVADTQDGVGYYKMTATITKEGVEGTVSKVSSENTIGVLAVKDAPATTIIGVPWKSLKDGDDISVDGLVRTENLTEGDEIQVYNAAEGKYKAWTLNANKEWEEVTTVTQDTTEDPGATTGTRLARGSGVWLTRKNPDEPIYLMGQTAAKAEPTPVEVPEEAGKEAWTLVASPKVEPVKVADVAAGEGDIIRMPTAGAPKDFKYRNGKWGYTEYYVDDNGLTRSRRVETDDKTTIPAGRGFWYINKSTDVGKKINWDTDND